MTELKPCPCGEIPERVYSNCESEYHKVHSVYSTCCATGWRFYFSSDSKIGADGEIHYSELVKAWNEAPRAEINNNEFCDAINELNKMNSEGCFEYSVYSKLYSLISNLKEKKGQ